MPKEVWATYTMFQLNQLRELSTKRRRNYTAVIKFSPDGGVRITETRIGTKGG